MKKRLKIVLILLNLGFLCLTPQVASPHPFAGPYVCLSPYKAGRGPLKIRDNGQCGEQDTWMEVQERKDGVLLILPAEPPLSKSKQKDWKNFKEYYGGKP